MENELLNESLKQLEIFKDIRKKLQKKDCYFVWDKINKKWSYYIINISNCIYNRQLDIFDDALFLLENNRIPSACILSRCIIETHAFWMLLYDKVSRKIDDNSKIEDILNTIIEFTNSSRIKKELQEEFKSWKLEADKYNFTEQALDRMINELAKTKHVMDWLRIVYENEIIDRKIEKSEYELLYNALSEWVHPSQTSVFHNYTTETHLIKTSFGEVHLYDFAKMQCINALWFIQFTQRLYDITFQLWNIIDKIPKK